MVTRRGLQGISAWNLFADRGRMSFRTSTGSCAHSEWKSHSLFRLAKGSCVFLFTRVFLWCYGLFVVTFSAILVTIYGLSFVGTGFRELVASFLCDARIFAGVSSSRFCLACYDGAFWELRLRIHFPWEFSQHRVHCFWQCGFFIMSEENIDYIRHGAVICNPSNSIFWGNVPCFSQNYLKLWLWIV